jgi:hypothetical protein
MPSSVSDAWAKLGSLGRKLRIRSAPGSFRQTVFAGLALRSVLAKQVAPFAPAQPSEALAKEGPALRSVLAKQGSFRQVAPVVAANLQT